RHSFPSIRADCFLSVFMRPERGTNTVGMDAASSRIGIFISSSLEAGITCCPCASSRAAPRIHLGAGQLLCADLFKSGTAPHTTYTCLSNFHAMMDTMASGDATDRKVDAWWRTTSGENSTLSR